MRFNHLFYNKLRLKQKYFVNFSPKIWLNYKYTLFSQLLYLTLLLNIMKSNLAKFVRTDKGRRCRLCKSTYTGRTDKIFCSATCKAQYHIKLNKVTMDAAQRIDQILHRNRSILLEVMGKNSSRKLVNRAILDSKKFHFGYVTHYYTNNKQELVNYVYDFSWIMTANQEILIKKNYSRKTSLSKAA